MLYRLSHIHTSQCKLRGCRMLWYQNTGPTENVCVSDELSYRTADEQSLQFGRHRMHHVHRDLGNESRKTAADAGNALLAQYRLRWAVRWLVPPQCQCCPQSPQQPLLSRHSASVALRLCKRKHIWGVGVTKPWSWLGWLQLLSRQSASAALHLCERQHIEGKGMMQLTPGGHM